MLIPVRCFTCGKVRLALLPRSPPRSAHLTRAPLLQVIGNKYETYVQFLLDGKTPA